MPTPVAQKSRNLRKWLAVAIFAATLAIYVYLYQTAPFPNGLTDLVTSGMTVVAACTAAIIGWMVFRRYGKGSPPRLTWMHFTLALFGWAIAEAIWLYEYWTDGNYILGPADIVWTLSYLFFIAALYSQYVLIYRPARSVGLAYMFLSILAVLAFTYLYALWLSGMSQQALSLQNLVNAFYAIADVALAFGALWLAFLFRDGALGRPWIGLVVFAVSDLLYAWLESSGLYAWSLDEGNLLTTITDTTYLAAYLSIAFGCYLHWLLLSYGPRFKQNA